MYIKSLEIKRDCKLCSEKKLKVGSVNLKYSTELYDNRLNHYYFL
ncbi:hypothetical protein SAMN04488524_3523 [Pedobacter africanus]|uniref:Uncharacterized protein n=1 Tax=Pedobacter africanus TaxID=151894 RepID=A0A1W2DB18_9SPHI|nr:hypothetical protein SAMN04488524_3523 [Pedobacter africanus]